MDNSSLDLLTENIFLSLYYASREENVRAVEMGKDIGVIVLSSIADSLARWSRIPPTQIGHVVDSSNSQIVHDVT